MTATISTPTTSAFLIQVGTERWELRNVLSVVACFGSGYEADPTESGLIAAGNFGACQGAARLLGFHIDKIEPLL
jgi:hypothetical protein